MSKCTCGMSMTGMVGNSVLHACPTVGCKGTVVGAHYGDCPLRLCPKCAAEIKYVRDLQEAVHRAGQKFRGYAKQRWRAEVE